MSFTDKLDALMADKRINKSVLSKESGIPYTTIAGFYAKGADNVKLSTLRKLSSYFGCTIDYLVDDDNTDAPATLSVHFDGSGYTEEQLKRIMEYAKFIKQELNK
ncbi:MAG TPA: helix-turn-helix transcriptional regulator [Candidatus Mediterraneibacter merdipullorum]|nr:helix-turn-helix transcriptional regulator [Candidatus Mediterraneibacter merdipullorum]